MTLTALGTYLPSWGTDRARVLGLDEDAVTLAVAAGTAALTGVDPAEVTSVVVVSRDWPLLEGGNSAPILAGLGVSSHVRVAEVIGGGPAVIDALTGADPGTLVIGIDAGGAPGAAAAWCSSSGVELSAGDRIVRSLPVTTRNAEGGRSDYADPRLLRVRGVGTSVERLQREAPIVAVAGLAARDAATLAEDTPPALPTIGASAPLFAVAAMLDAGTTGDVLTVEQATAVLASLGTGRANVVRDERAPRPVPMGMLAAGSDLPISLSAYDRAFDAKLRLEAARCRTCGTLSYPHRFRCLTCGSEEPTDSVALPRDAEIYTLATIRVPVPGLVSPYTLTLVELGDSGVRVLVRLTGAEAGTVAIGAHGTLVFRLVAVRSGVPDYGYGFLPDEPPDTQKEAAA